MYSLWCNVGPYVFRYVFEFPFSFASLFAPFRYQKLKLCLIILILAMVPFVVLVIGTGVHCEIGLINERILEVRESG